MAATEKTERSALNVREIFPQLDDIRDARLRAQVEEVWQELWEASKWRSFDDMPTSKEIPYPAKPHSQCVLEMALAIADKIEKHHHIAIDRDRLIASAILQDASKVVEYDPGPEGAAVHTPIGKSFPHAFWCAHVALNKGIPLEIVHVIMTHSPGAAQFPQTLEGKILYYADQLDVIAIFGDRWVKHLMVERQRK